MTETLTQQQLEAVHCWEADDGVPGRPAMTAFRRLRFHQSQWREARGHPVGAQPIAPRPVLDTGGLPPATQAALRERYLPS